MDRISTMKSIMDDSGLEFGERKRNPWKDKEKNRKRKEIYISPGDTYKVITV
jgi:hypothetical protein